MAGGFAAFAPAPATPLFIWAEMPDCPICKRPLHHPGRVVTASTGTDQYVVVTLCADCVRAEAKLPRLTGIKRTRRAVEVALRDPQRFGVESFGLRFAADATAAILADRYGNHRNHAGNAPEPSQPVEK